MELKINIKKSGLVTGLIILILLAVYNVLFFVIPFDFSKSGASFWVTYGCTTFATLFVGVVVALGLAGKELKSKLFGLPIIKLAYTYLVAQYVIDAVVMPLGHFYVIWTWLVAVVETILFALYFLSLIVRVAYKDTVNKVDKCNNDQFINKVRIEAKSLLNQHKSSNEQKLLNKLVDIFTYADPVSNRYTIDVEDNILNILFEIRLIENNNVNLEKKINEISSLMQERQLILKDSRK